MKMVDVLGEGEGVMEAERIEVEFGLDLGLELGINSASESLTAPNNRFL